MTAGAFAARIHVALVSDQTLANLIPAMMERPDVVHLVCSKEMTARGLDRRIAQVLREDAIDVTFHRDAPDAGFANIRDFGFTVAQQIQDKYPGADIVLNATGGTKLMAMAFVDVFRYIDARIIYTDTFHHRIECLPNDPKNHTEPRPMRDVLDVPRYLAAQGFRFKSAVSDDPEWRERASKRKAACKYLGQNAVELQDLIGAVNGLAKQAFSADETLGAPRQRFATIPYGRWATALGKLVQCQLLVWQDGNAEIEFTDEESARFLHGGWIEEYVWNVLRDNDVYDCRLGVTGKWETGGTAKNEFDVLATKRNELLFVECKTGRHEGEKDTALAYKTDSLGQDARGLFGATWVVAAREPSPMLHQRAQQSRFRVIGPSELPHLRATVRKWIEEESQ